MAEYTYDITNQTVDDAALDFQIRNDVAFTAIFHGLRRTSNDRNTLRCVFAGSLGGGDEALLATYVANHDGLPLEGSEDAKVSADMDMEANNLKNVTEINGVDFTGFNEDTVAHVSSTSNPHGVALSQLGATALAALNTLLTDATLDDAAQPRTPSSHAASHGSGGADALGHGDLAGLGDDDHAQYHTDARALTWLESRSTADLAEVTNLYYTPARVAGHSDVAAAFTHSELTAANPHGITPAMIAAIPASEKAVAGGVATLDGGGKIPASQLPAEAIIERYVVADATARLALTVQSGDLCYQTDTEVQYLYDGTSWIALAGTSGDVTGPNSSTDSALALFDGITGKVIRNSGITSDGSSITVSGNVNVTGTVDGVDVAAFKVLSDAHASDASNPHNTSLSTLNAGTLADLNVLVADATLDDASAPRDPNAHVGSHGKNGTDPLIVQNASSDNAAADQILVTDGSGGFTLAGSNQLSDGEMCSLSFVAPGLSITGGWTSIPWDTQTLVTQGFSHTNGGTEIIWAQGGRLIGNAAVAVDMDSGNSRTGWAVRVQADTGAGAGYVTLDGCDSGGYARTSSVPRGAAPMTFGGDYPAGTKFRVQAQRYAGSGAVKLLTNGTSIVIHTNKGQKGDAGVGATVAAQDAGVTLAGGPFHTLNFGDNIHVESTVAGVLTISHDLNTYNDKAFATADTSTFSGAYGPMLNMALTVDQPGDFDLAFTTTVIGTAAGRGCQAAVFVDGVFQSGSQKPAMPYYDLIPATLTLLWTLDSLSAGALVEIHWMATAAATYTARERVMTLRGI